MSQYREPAMTAWKAYIQFAALRSRAVLAQRESLQAESSQANSEDDIPTQFDLRPHLVIYLADGSIHYWLDQKMSWKIGRNSDCEITITDQWISRYHAAVQFVEPDEFYLVDLQSYNGSFINERRIRDIAKLENGDRIRLGKTEIDFYACPSAKPGGHQTATDLAAMAERVLRSSTPVAR